MMNAGLVEDTLSIQHTQKTTDMVAFGEVARFPYAKDSENRLKSKAIQGGFRFFYGIQEVYN